MEETEVAPELLDHATNPRNVGELQSPDGIGEHRRPGCGDSITVHIKVANDRITAIRYLPRSCVTTLACISVASTMVEGRPPLDVRRSLDAASISEALGGLPDSELHSAEIARRAINAAIDDYLVNRREPWKKLYRNN